jgi:putative spermidine/putrescine transport system permease protein
MRATATIRLMEAVLPFVAGGASLKTRLRRAERVRRFRAFLLVSPLLLYIFIIFLVPIGLMLVRAVYDPDMAHIAPQTLSALAGWDGQSIPEEPVFAALAADMKVATSNQEVGLLGKRINYEIPGSRSIVLGTARKIGRLRQGPYKDAFINADPIWGGREIWTVIRRAGDPITPFYLLAAIDRHVDADGHLVRVAPDDAIFVDVLLRTLGISTLVTLATLVLGYPVAFLLSTLPPKTRNLLMIVVLLPFFTSLLVRTTAWVVLLQTNGVINDTLLALGLIQQRLQMIFQRSGTLVAMVHIQLPFTLLPIYSVMGTIKPGLTRAARSLGATPFTAFRRVYVPLTMPGIGAGCLLTFILSLGYYITPALVGGPSDQMVSSFVASYMNRELNWGMASALGAVLLALTLVIYVIYTKLLGVERMRFG